MKKLLLKVFILLVLCWEAVQYWPVTVQVRNLDSEEVISIRMPLKDKKRLEFFFREICFLNIWAYTLFGSKPMSIDQYTKPWCAFRTMVKHPDLKDIVLDCIWPLSFQKIGHLLTPRELKMKLGWEALNKYSHYLPSSRFFLYTSQRDGDEIVDLILVDKIKLIKTVKEHLEDFQDLLKNQAIIPEDLLHREVAHKFLKSLKHNGLFGTLLGFGRDNAWLFCKYHRVNPHERPMVSAWPEEEMINLEQLNQRTLSFQPWDLSDLFYPRFACDPHSEETKQLRQTYQEEREKIVQYYEGKDLVEATLSLFISPQSAK